MLKRIQEKVPLFVRENMYIWTFILWYSWVCLRMSNIEKYFGIDMAVIEGTVHTITMLLLLFQWIFVQKHSKEEALIAGAGIVLSSVVMATSMHYSLLYLWLFIAAAKYENKERIFKYAYYILLGSVVLICGLCFLGYIPNESKLIDGIEYFAYGFMHPNTFGTAILQLMAYRMYRHRRAIRIIDVILSVAEIAFTYIFLHSRAACIAMAAIMLGFIVLRCAKKMPKLKAIFPWILIIICIGCNLFSIVSSVAYRADSELFVELDNILSQRLLYASNAVHQYGFSIFGTETTLYIDLCYDDEIITYIDNSYVYLLINDGILVYLASSILYIGTAIYLKKKNKYALLMMFAAFAGHAVMEKTLCALDQNIFLLVISMYIYQKDTKISK